ncbi:MAG TPA: aminotransferase class III-fold pyridoxal phosphate-dependent enzyme [Gemmatimonadaceae bacterium]|nr:aminotransferase class III-fold pyridoxal phosphate-dependent enzyme [Gemmatimonadaceae bacterium]
MVFSRLFGKGQPAPADQAPPPEEDAPGDDVAVGDEAGGDDPGWAHRAANVIPLGASTGSKRPAALYGRDEELGPTHFMRAAGCRVQTTDGDMLVDCTMALGSVALGYAEPQLTRAVIETIANGSVSGLSPALEVEVAERFCGVVPCSEKVQFLKTGAEAMSAAVRLARTYTGRDIIIGSGYFGWHDWASTAAGVPDNVCANFRSIPFDDIPALERAVSEAGANLAAVVFEPVVERLPSKDWVARARALCDAKGAALIFDEIKTGFRLATGGYQQHADIVPDLAAFGKAMANGFPVSAVCGKADLMDAGHKTWISSTLASEAGALAAVGAVLAWHERADICATLWSTGKEMRQVVDDALTASGLSGITTDGIDPMWFLRFDEPAVESDFVVAAARHGVLFKRGAYNFAAIAHDDDAIREIESGASAAFVELRERAERESE